MKGLQPSTRNDRLAGKANERVAHTLGRTPKLAVPTEKSRFVTGCRGVENARFFSYVRSSTAIVTPMVRRNT